MNLVNKFNEFAYQFAQIVVVYTIHERLHGVADLDRGGDDWVPVSKPRHQTERVEHHCLQGLGMNLFYPVDDPIQEPSPLDRIRIVALAQECVRLVLKVKLVHARQRSVRDHVH